jgi:hypothetical protein
MELWGGAAQAAAALVFAASAAAKLRNPAPTAEALSVVGIRGRVDSLVVVPLVVVELTLATLLFSLDGIAAIGPAILALGAFSLFLAYLARNAPDAACGCLGDVGSRNHGAGIARNLLLIGLLVFAGFAGVDQTALTVSVGAQLALLVTVSTEGVATLRALHTLSSRPAAT